MFPPGPFNQAVDCSAATYAHHIDDPGESSLADWTARAAAAIARAASVGFKTRARHAAASSSSPDALPQCRSTPVPPLPPPTPPPPPPHTHTSTQQTDRYNFCTVPNSGADVVLVASASVVLGCVAAASRAPELAVLFAGAAAQATAFRVGAAATSAGGVAGSALAARLANGVALWLGLRPADLLALIFLPPMLLYDAARIDFFLLRRLALQTAILAVVTVAATALGLVPVMLGLLGLRAEGWRAVDVALFGATLASTDAVSVSSVLESGGAPEALATILQAEALFNDATSMTLFELFREMAAAPAAAAGAGAGAWAVAQEMVSTVARLSAVGAAVGLAFGLANVLLLRLIQRRRAPVEAEVALPLGLAYLAYYLAQFWLGGSGVVAVVVYGLTGSATTLWGLSPWARAAGAFDGFWSVAAFAINGAVFFFAGASSANFLLRASATIFREAGVRGVLVRALVRLPVVYGAVFAIRAGVMLVLFPLLGWLGAERTLDPRSILFATAGGLRGALCLILAQTLVAGGGEEGGGGGQAARALLAGANAGGHGPSPPPTPTPTPHDVDDVLASSALWASGFTIMTLVINGPLLKPLLSKLKLDAPTPQELAARRSGVELLQRAAAAAVAGLRAGGKTEGGVGGGEVLRGVDWRAVEEVVDLSKQVKKLGLGPDVPRAAAAPSAAAPAPAAAAPTPWDAATTTTPRRASLSASVTRRPGAGLGGGSNVGGGLKEPLLPLSQALGGAEAAAAGNGAAGARPDDASAAEACNLLGLDDTLTGGGSSDEAEDSMHRPSLPYPTSDAGGSGGGSDDDDDGEDGGGGDHGDEDEDEDEDEHDEAAAAAAAAEPAKGGGKPGSEQPPARPPATFALFPPGKNAGVLRVCPGGALPRAPSFARSLGGGASMRGRSRRFASDDDDDDAASGAVAAERRALREQRRGVVSDVFMLQRADSAVLDRRFALPRRGLPTPSPPPAAAPAAAPPARSSHHLPTSRPAGSPHVAFAADANNNPPGRSDGSFMSRFGLTRLSFLHRASGSESAVPGVSGALLGTADRAAPVSDAGPVLVLHSHERAHRHRHRQRHPQDAPPRPLRLPPMAPCRPPTARACSRASSASSTPSTRRACCRARACACSSTRATWPCTRPSGRWPSGRRSSARRCGRRCCRRSRA